MIIPLKEPLIINQSLSVAVAETCHGIEHENFSDYIVFDVRKANKQVWKFHESAGAIKLGESEIDYYYYLYNKNYFSKRSYYIKLLTNI